MPGSLSPPFRSWSHRALIALFCSPVLCPAAESIDAVEKSAGEWAKLRVETVRLETDWKIRREMLESSLTALRERIRSLEARRAALLTKSATERQTLAEAKESAAAAGKTMVEITHRLELLTENLAKLRPSLPPRLASALELPYRSLADASIAPGDRMQLIVKMLNRCSQFNKSVTLADEVLAPEGGTDPRMLEVVYWGLSHAYALDRVNGKSYFGYPGESAWLWEPLSQQTEKVAALIAIYKDKADPVLVEVPARVTDFPSDPKL